MKLFKFPEFVANETGAVTVDWVVLTAAIVGVAIAMMSVVRDGVTETATEINDALTAQLS